MGKSYDNIIQLTAGFKYSSNKPIDDRLVVDTHLSLSELSNKGIAYQGMIVSVIHDTVIDNNGVYQYIDSTGGNNPEWTKIATISSSGGTLPDGVYLLGGNAQS